jgi:hypothetical protein
MACPARSLQGTGRVGPRGEQGLETENCQSSEPSSKK